MEKIRVCFLTSSFPRYQGDTNGIFVYHLADHLSTMTDMQVICPYYAESTHKNELIGHCHVTRFQYWYPKSLQFITSGVGIADNFRKTPLLILQFPFYVLSQFFTALNKLRHCDVIHAHWILSGLVGTFLKKITKKPLVVTLRGSDITLSLQYSFLKMLFIFVLKNADSITSVSTEIVKVIVRLGISPEKVVFIPNGVDTRRFKLRDKDKERKQLALPVHSSIILYVGRISEAKGVSVLLESFAELISRHKNATLLLIGEGDIDVFAKQAQSLNISPCVRFLGKRSQETVAHYLSAADLFVLPSYAEGRPNVVLEALASGTPVVTTDVGDIRSFMVHGKNGFIVPAKDPSSLAQHMRRILSQATLHNIFSKAGIQTIKQHNLSWNLSAQQYAALYKQILRHEH